MDIIAHLASQDLAIITMNHQIPAKGSITMAVEVTLTILNPKPFVNNIAAQPIGIVSVVLAKIMAIIVVAASPVPSIIMMPLLIHANL